MSTVTKLTWVDLVKKASLATNAGFGVPRIKDIAEVWEEFLGEPDAKLINLHLKSSSDFPTVAGLLRLRHSEYPSLVDGWNQIVRRFDAVDSGQTDAEVPHKLVSEARRIAGVTGTTRRDREAWEVAYTRLLNESRDGDATEQAPGEEETG